MSGARCKALRKAFRAQHGRAPWKTRFEGSRLFSIGERSSYSYIPSEWRRLKKTYQRGRS